MFCINVFGIIDLRILCFLELDIDEVKSKWQSRNTQTLGELWVSLLKFYASNCDSPDYVVSIDNSEPKFRQPKRINIVGM